MSGVERAVSVAEASPPVRSRSAADLLRLLRPDEWIKNFFVLTPLLFSGSFDGHALRAGALTFVAFCLMASAGYIVNDLVDAAADREHPKKRHRPIASGLVAPSTARVLSVILATAAVAVGAAVKIEVGLIVAGYGALTVTYTLVLKRLVIVDVMTIAGCFVARILGGSVAVGAESSKWIILCTAMVALFLGFTKRRQEAVSEAHDGRASRPVLEHYSLPFLDQMVSMVTAGTIISYAIYATESPLVGEKMLYTTPFVFYGIFRYLYLIYHRADPRSTSRLLTSDPGMFTAAVLWVVTTFILIQTA